MIKPDIDNKSAAEVVVVQPNIDPYYEKYGSMSYSEQVELMISLSDSLVTNETDILVWPETAVLYLDLDRLNGQKLVKLIRTFLNRYPNLSLVPELLATDTIKTKKLKQQNHI